MILFTSCLYLLLSSYISTSLHSLCPIPSLCDTALLHPVAMPHGRTFIKRRRLGIYFAHADEG